MRDRDQKTKLLQFQARGNAVRDLCVQLALFHALWYIFIEYQIPLSTLDPASKFDIIRDRKKLRERVVGMERGCGRSPKRCDRTVMRQGRHQVRPGGDSGKPGEKK
ncbi:MAG: hypothetical protein ACR2PM_20370 [Hyphomicrobiales bacterium]